MPTQRKAEYLIADTTAFIKNANLQELSANVYTVQGVVDEITNKRQLRRLAVLPYDLKIKDVFTENVKIVTEFSKKTGDYSSLSAVDIQVIALAYQLEKEHVGVGHLRSEPQVKKVERLTQEIPGTHLTIAGFYMPPRKNKKEDEEISGNVERESDSDIVHDLESGQEKEDEIEGEKIQVSCSEIKQLEDISKIDTHEVQEVDNNLTEIAPELLQEEGRDVLQEPFKEKILQTELEETQAMRDLEETLQNTDIKDLPESEIQPWATTIEDEVKQNFAGEEESEEEDDIWDDNVWITPGNVEEAKRELQGAVEEESSVKVACITADFAMQNVLKQLGLHVLAADGRMIKQLRTFILRCYACFKTTSKMDVIFCPHCGNRTLRRASVLLRPDGTQEVLVSFRRPPTGRGKRFSLPKPQGGKYANNPILCPDQRIPQQFVSKLARTKNNPLEPDYIAGYSPFVMRDITSRSATLGIRNNHSKIKNWMRGNPNEVIKKGKKRR